MRFSAIVPVVLVNGSLVVCAGDSQNLHERQSTGTCSIGIGRQSGSINWDVTVYNVPQPLRQLNNIITTLTNAPMDKGQSINITSLAQPITITNIDNAPVFDYDSQELNASLSSVDTGLTKVKLQFDIPDADLTWTTDNCTAGSVVISAGRESWSCDFACTVAASKLKEL